MLVDFVGSRSGKRKATTDEHGFTQIKPAKQLCVVNVLCSGRCVSASRSELIREEGTADEYGFTLIEFAKELLMTRRRFL